MFQSTSSQTRGRNLSAGDICMSLLGVSIHFLSNKRKKLPLRTKRTIPHRFNPLPLKQEEETHDDATRDRSENGFNPLPLKQEEETLTEWMRWRDGRVSIHFLSNKRKKPIKDNESGTLLSVSIHFLSNKRKKPKNKSHEGIRILFQSTSSQTRGRNDFTKTDSAELESFNPLPLKQEEETAA